jgi:hypothetical protein
MLVFLDPNYPPSRMPIEKVEILAVELAIFLVGSEKI